ncbi:MAG TPA: tetratricopeptide repeat protein [Ignavibacteriaceae bacterium]|nr:tetratricopeptide repeat protein [Ignavibacteriaceae bacterium]
MERTQKIIFEEKISLIYEHNTRSPLFVRAANIQIENNNAGNAIHILKSGLELYPGYPTALFILGKALAVTGKYDEAVETFREACTLIDSNDSLVYYKSEVEKIKQQRSPFESKRRTTLIEEMPDEQKKESDRSYFRVNDKESDDDSKKELPDQKISIIAKHTSELTDNFNDSVGDKLIISDTFANILIAQERYDEAVTVLKELMSKNPGRTQEYVDKINSISQNIS